MAAIGTSSQLCPVEHAIASTSVAGEQEVMGAEKQEVPFTWGSDCGHEEALMETAPCTTGSMLKAGAPVRLRWVKALEAVMEIVPSFTIALLVAVDENLPEPVWRRWSLLQRVMESMMEKVPTCIVALLQAMAGMEAGEEEVTEAEEVPWSHR